MEGKLAKKDNKTQNSYKELKECVDDYIKHIEVINEKRFKYQSRELSFLQQEAIAFNLLRKNIKSIELSDTTN